MGLVILIPKKKYATTVKDTQRKQHIFRSNSKGDTYCNMYINESLPNRKYDVKHVNYNYLFNINMKPKSTQLCHNCATKYHKKWSK